MQRNQTLHYQNTVLKTLAHKIDDFYLAGGTALGLFYFQHRLSMDLDFFTTHFVHSRVKEIVRYLKSSLKARVKIVAQSLEKDRTKMVIYNIYFPSGDSLKIDFIEDVQKLIKKPKIVEGINILSLEDIYIRKIYAISGVIETFDKAGCKKFIGGRRDAKDFYDLYFLSHTFMSFSKFADKYCDATIREGLIRWFRTYDRMNMMDGILTLNTDKKIDCKSMEKHFKKEIDKIIEKELGEE